MDQYALVTGASKGIGKFIAIELAKKGYNLLLVARSQEQLSSVQQEIKTKFHIQAEILSVDLSDYMALNQITDWIKNNDFSVSVLVNNAGFGLYGEFKDQSIAEVQSMLNLNIIALSTLTGLMIPVLKSQPKSYILNVASTAAFQAMPYMGVYAASKAYVLSFSRALRFELKHTGISVTCLCPGPVNTFFWERANTPAIKAIQRMSKQPNEVAKIGVKALFENKLEVIAGKMNWIGAFSNRFLPKSLVERLFASVFKN